MTHPIPLSLEHAQITPSLVVMPGLFRDAGTLLLEAHDYFTSIGQEECAALPLRESLMYHTEMSRITTRLSSVVAWLLRQKAALIVPDARQAGGMPAASGLCLYVDEEARVRFSPTMVWLMDATLALYQRALRLGFQAADGERAARELEALHAPHVDDMPAEAMH